MQAGAPELPVPDWEALPSPDDLARYYPTRAQVLGQQGSAAIGCTVTAAGGLADCVVLSEVPTDYGFGQAALRMSVLFKVRTVRQDGSSAVGATVRVPIRFSLGAALVTDPIY